MTFSVLATDRFGAVGMAVTSSSPAVAARCIHLRPGVGGASSQNITDPRLGGELLDALASGLDAEAAIAMVVAGREHIEHRQLTVLDLDGRGAAYSGAGSLGIHRHVVGHDVVVAGNLLAGAGNYSGAIERYREALQLRPDYAEAENNFGTALTLLGRPAEAVEHYRAAVRIRPDNAGANNNLGLALARIGRLQEAVSYFEAAVRLAPE